MLHLLNIWSLERNRQALAVAPTPKHGSNTIAPGLVYLLMRWLISAAGFCSEQSIGRLPILPVPDIALFMLNTVSKIRVEKSSKRPLSYMKIHRFITCNVEFDRVQEHFRTEPHPSYVNSLFRHIDEMNAFSGRMLREVPLVSKKHQYFDFKPKITFLLEAYSVFHVLQSDRLRRCLQSLSPWERFYF